MSALYIIAGLNHFRTPEPYIRIIPGILLIPLKTRRASAWLIIAMLNVFFIIHVQMIIDFSKQGNPLLWLAIARIPLQFVLIWWAWIYAKKAPIAE